MGIKPPPSIMHYSSIPKSDLFRDDSNSKMNGFNFHGTNDSQSSNSTPIGIPGVPTVVLDSLNKSSPRIGPSRSRAAKSKNIAKKLSSPAIAKKEVKVLTR